MLNNRWLFICVFFFKQYLRNDLLEPSDAPDLSKFWLVDMFHHYTDPKLKSNIVSSFNGTSLSQLRVVICTMAFGLGIDCVGVNQVIHFGPTNDKESETGRCGRDARQHSLLRKRFQEVFKIIWKYILIIRQGAEEVLCLMEWKVTVTQYLTWSACVVTFITSVALVKIFINNNNN